MMRKRPRRRWLALLLALCMLLGTMTTAFADETSPVGSSVEETMEETQETATDGETEPEKESEAEFEEESAAESEAESEEASEAESEAESEEESPAESEVESEGEPEPETEWESGTEESSPAATTPVQVNELAENGSAARQSSFSDAQAQSLTENAAVSSYIIGDETPYYNNDASKGNIKDIEEASWDRLIDGVMAAGRKAEDDWVSGSWDDPQGLRSLYVNMYRGDSRDITIDLGQISHVTEAALHIGVCGGYGINPLTEVEFYLSENGTDYYHVGTVTQEQAEADEADPTDLTETEPSHLYYRLTGLNYNARYLRVRFTVGTWVFADELLAGGSTAPSENADPFNPDDLLEEEVSRESYATPSQSGGVHHEYLAYQGWGTVNSELTETYKTVDEYKAAVAYLDEDGQPQDWLYDGITVLGHAYTSDGGLFVISGSNTDYADKADWDAWLNHIYNYRTQDGQAANMDALEQAVAEVKEAMVAEGILTREEADSYVVPVKIAVYPTIHSFSDWGTTDETVHVTKAEDGTLSITGITQEPMDCDFTLAGNGGDVDQTLTARASAYYWYMKKAAEMFAEKDYQNIALSGFYFYNEILYPVEDSLAEDSVKLYNMLVDYIAQEKGYEKLYSYWIPYYTATGYKNWEDYGFDYAIMQPNAYGYGQARLDTAADFSYFYGLGVEMEWMGMNTPGYVDTFIQYLTTGAAKGYQEGVQAWYWGTWDLAQLCRGEGSYADYRYIYDLTYQYISGNAVYSDNLLQTAQVSLKFRNAADTSALDSKLYLLYDGVYGDEAVWSTNVLQINNNSFQAPTEIVAKLAETSAVTSLQLYFYDWQSAGVYEPYVVQYFVSADGEDWQLIGTAKGEDDYKLTVPDGLAADYVMARIINYAENSTLKAWIGVEEFVISGSPTTRQTDIPQIEENLLTQNENVQLTLTDSAGTPVVPSNTNELSVLIDGEQGGAWNGGYYCWSSTAYEDPFDLTVDLGEEFYVNAAGLSLYEWMSAGVGLPESVNIYGSADGTSWTYLGTVKDYVVTAGNTSDGTDAAFILELSDEMLLRYVRFNFARSENLYLQNGRNNWIAPGEVMVSGRSANEGTDAEQLTENLLDMDAENMEAAFIGTPNVNGEAGLETVNSLLYLLTDNIFGSSYPGTYNNPDNSPYVGFNYGWTGSYDPAAWNSGWENEGYRLSADLGALYELSGIAIDFLSYESASVMPPEMVTFWVSTDGESWTMAGTAAAQDALVKAAGTASGQTKNYYVINMDDAPVVARYIRWEFALADRDENGTYAFVMFDEIQAAGTAHEHTYEETVVAPTETEQGYTLHLCSRCGYSYRDQYVPAVGTAPEEPPEESTEGSSEGSTESQQPPAGGSSSSSGAEQAPAGGSQTPTGETESPATWMILAFMGAALLMLTVLMGKKKRLE